MATQRETVKTVIQAAADLSACQYHAIQLSGSVATKGFNAIGIIQGKPSSGDNAEVVYYGEAKFAAGVPCSFGLPLTVTGSGWIVPASYGDRMVGTCRAAVTSGSIGTGYFDFAAVAGVPGTTGAVLTVTAAEAIGQGYAYALKNNLIANNGGDCSGVTQATMTQSGTGYIIMNGIALVRAANSYGAGANLSVATSGYFTLVTSGLVGVAHTLSAVASGQLGLAYVSIPGGTTLIA